MKKKKSSLMEDERREKAQREYSGWNPKRHIWATDEFEVVRCRSEYFVWS